VAICQRTSVLALLFLTLTLLTTVFLCDVLAAVFFSITVAYVLFPLSAWFIDQGLPKRLSAGVTTAIAFLAGTLITVPLIVVLYLRRLELVVFLRQLPATIPVQLGEFQYTIDAQPALVGLRNALTQLAVELSAS